MSRNARHVAPSRVRRIVGTAAAGAVVAPMALLALGGTASADEDVNLDGNLSPTLGDVSLGDVSPSLGDVSVLDSVSVLDGASVSDVADVPTEFAVSDLVTPVLNAPVEAPVATDLPVTGELGLENVGQTATDLTNDLPVTGELGVENVGQTATDLAGDVAGGDVTGDLTGNLPIVGDAGAELPIVGSLTGGDITNDLPVVGDADLPVVGDLVSVDSILGGIL